MPSPLGTRAVITLQVDPPLAIGLIFASAIALIRGTQHDPAAYALTAAATLALTATEAHPLLILGAGAAAGYLLGL